MPTGIQRKAWMGNVLQLSSCSSQGELTMECLSTTYLIVCEGIIETA